MIRYCGLSPPGSGIPAIASSRSANLLTKQAHSLYFVPQRGGRQFQEVGNRAVQNPLRLARYILVRSVGSSWSNPTTTTKREK